MRTVIIEKRKWHTQGGRTKTDSQLRSSQSKRMCCLGFAAQQAGCKDITNVAEPSLLKDEEYKKFLSAYPKINCDTLIDINDDKETTREEKAQKITDAGRRMGVKFVFV